MKIGRYKRTLFPYSKCRGFMPANYPFSFVLLEKQSKSEGFDSCDRPSNCTQIGFKSSFVSPCDHKIWWMTSKNNRIPLLYYVKLCASLNSLTPPSAAYMRQCTGSSLVDVTACRLFGAKPLPQTMLAYCQLGSREYISVKFEFECYHFHSRKCIWKCCLSKRQPFCPGGEIKSSGEFKMELQSGNAQFGSKLAILCPAWPWNLVDDLEKQ